MKYVILGAVMTLAAVAVVGCDRREYGMADDSILCHPVKKEAYVVQPSAGQTSFVRRNHDMDYVCNIQK